MKVFILTEGGINVGFGHITRCISLYEAFKEHGIRPLFIINNSPEAKDFLKKNRIKFIIDSNFEIMDCGIIIIDSYLKQKEFYNAISEKAKLLVSMDDFNRLDYPTGLVINGAIYAKSIKYRKNKNLAYILATEYSPLRKDFWKIGPAKRINRKAKNILITLGGFNDDFAKKVVELLLKKFDFNLHVVSRREISLAKDNKILAYRNISSREMKDLMLMADICICGGGQTTYELARCGVPSIGICFSDNQLLNLKSWFKTGFLHFAGWHNDKDLFKKIENAIKKLLSYEDRINRHRIGMDCVDGKGAIKIVNRLICELKKNRKMKVFL